MDEFYSSRLAFTLSPAVLLLNTLMSKEVINLDSDEEIQILNPVQVVHAKTKTPIESINIESEDSDVDELDIIKNTSTEHHEAINHTTELQEVNKQVLETLTPKQLLRKQMAEAAEQRLKRKIDTTADMANDTPLKVRKIEQQEILNEPAYNSKIPQAEGVAVSAFGNGQSSRIRMIANPEYCQEYGVNTDTDAVSLSDMIGSKDLVKTYQFNMLIDFDYLERYVTNKSCEFILINKSDDDHLHIKPSSWERFKIHTIDVSHKLPKFGTHHSKMMINFHKDFTCQLIIHTMNLTEADYKIQTQMCWMSPRLKVHQNPSQYLDFNQPGLSILEDTGTVFKRDFIAYLLSYENPEINKIVDQIGKYDFTPIDVVFVGSSPGSYEYQEWNDLIKPEAKPMFGYGRLWQVIHMLKLQSLSGKFVGQASTIAGPCDNWKRNILVYMLTSCAEKGYPMIKKADYTYKSGKSKLEPVIIWPTTEEVLKSRCAPLSGVALHFTTTGKWAAYQRQYEDIKKYLYKWSAFAFTPKSSKAGRSNLAPHVKTYTVTEDDFKTLKWFLMTSANISHQAWGKFEKFNLLKYTVSSFEAGVFVAPQLLNVNNPSNKTPVLIPAYGKDTVEDVHLLSENKLKIGIRLPYDTPLKKYVDSDEPWCQPDSDKYF